MQSDRNWTSEQDLRFQKVYTKVSACEVKLVAERHGDRGFDRELLQKVVRQELPKGQDQDDYYSWVIDRFAASTKSRRETRTLTVDNCKNVIVNTDLVNEDQVLQLTGLLNRVPYPYIGMAVTKNSTTV